jgi:ribonuclease HI
MADNSIEIFCDGACDPRSGVGGWGAVLLCHSKKRRRWRKLEISCGSKHTTNNRMELTAAIEALKRLKQVDCNIKLYSDSLYLINAFNKSWIKRWVKNNWVNYKKEPVANRDLWEELMAVNNRHFIEWRKVKGHSGNKYNEESDLLAVKAKKQQYYQSNYSWINHK